MSGILLGNEDARNTILSRQQGIIAASKGPYSSGRGEKKGWLPLTKMSFSF
jgi:hypothetical protein